MGAHLQNFEVIRVRIVVVFLARRVDSRAGMCLEPGVDNATEVGECTLDPAHEPVRRLVELLPGAARLHGTGLNSLGRRQFRQLQRELNLRTVVADNRDEAVEIAL